MTSADISVGNQPAHQFISFVEGSSSEAPDISAYPLQVLEADHNLNHLDGGDPTDGFAPWVTDILVYPSSEYWEGQLEGDKIRPYIDFSISNYNTLRIPSAVHNYNLYVDDARVYGDLTIDGDTNLNGTVEVTGTIVPSSISYANGSFSVSTNGDIVAGNIKGVSNLSLSIESKENNFTPSEEDSGAVYHCSPVTANILVTLPSIADDGVSFTFINAEAGKTVTFNNLNARGNILSEQFSVCSVYRKNGSWYGFGDLV
jgi:hypothetical protein